MKAKPVLKIVIFLLMPSMLLIISGQQKAEWKGTIEENDGVMIVRNPKEPMYGGDVLDLKEELCIGKTDGRDDYTFFRAWYLAVDDEENMYIMDQGETHIKVFDRNGTFLRSIGSRGEGPGELFNPNRIFITSGNQLVIEDFIRNLTFYTLDGKYIKAQSTVSVFPIEVLVGSTGQIFAITNIKEPDRTGKEVKLYDENLNHVKTIISIPKPKPDPRILMPFQPEINWAIFHNDSIIISFEKDYELQIFNAQGELSKKITKEYEPVKITEQDVKLRVRRVPEGRKLVVPKYFPAVHSITTDDKGRIFVHTYEKAGEGKYHNDVFDSEGSYVAKVALKDHLQVWKKDRVYTIEEDEDGHQYVKRYKVTWKF